jgi:hypothetical protein
MSRRAITTVLAAALIAARQWRARAATDAMPSSCIFADEFSARRSIDEVERHRHRTDGERRTAGVGVDSSETPSIVQATLRPAPTMARS